VKTKAIYSGSFDPIHNGHIDIISRSARLFNLEVVVANNPSKQYALTLEQRLNLVNKVVETNELPVRVSVMPSGLLVDYAQLRGAPLIIKGVRGFADFDYERALHEISVSQQGGVQTVLMPGLSSLQHVSSTAVKELTKLHGDLTHYAPMRVIAAMQQAINKQRIIGVTGGIGVGKSTLCRYLQLYPPTHNEDIAHIDLDKLVADIYNDAHEPAIQDMLQALGEQLGMSRNAGDWSLDTLKRLIKERLFIKQDRDFQKYLSAQLMPFVLVKLRSALAYSRAKTTAARQVVLLESALLCQEGLLYLCNNTVWHIVAPDDTTRIDRVTSSRPLSREDVVTRIAAQWSDERISKYIQVSINDDHYGSLKQLNGVQHIPTNEDTVGVLEIKRERLKELLQNNV
jgi:pantetheine-phosphate adenylyltransferase